MSCLKWCIQHNIEYVEACASNAVFDKCLSVDGDSQGVERLFGALSAHIWPGMILKSGDKITEPSLPEKQELSEEDSDYEVEYEVLSADSAEPWDDTGGWVSANSASVTTGKATSDAPNPDARDCAGGSEVLSVQRELQPSTSLCQNQEEIGNEVMPGPQKLDEDSDSDEGRHYEFEDLEQLMFEIGNIRENLRLVPDFQRREMAATLAMKMASMFGDNNGDEESNL